jgi:hypothetical protein
MSEDETFVMIGALIIGSISWTAWLWRAVAVKRLLCPGSLRLVLLFVPLACAGITFAVLRTLAAEDVRDAPIYMLLYLALGAAWVGVARLFLPLLGISPRDDVLERRNPAALLAVSGALVGLTLCYAGANIGNGPGWWVVVVTAGLATAAFWVLWAMMDRLGHFSDWITIDRDRASGCRLAGALVAIGLVLGRAAAGDWHSLEATLADFVRVGWFAAILAASAVLVERFLHPTAEQHQPPLLAGIPPALVYLGGAAAYAAMRGWP